MIYQINQAGFLKFTKHSLVMILMVCTILFSGGLIYLFGPWTKSAQATWFNDDWAYRKSLVFTHNAAASNTYIQLDIDTTDAPDKFQADCGDVRFTDANGNLLQYFYDSAAGACDTASTDFNVLIPSIVNGSNLIYLYYGNPTVRNATPAVNFSQSETTPSGGAPTLGSEEKGPKPKAYWKLDEGYGTSSNSSPTAISPVSYRQGKKCNAAAAGATSVACSFDSPALPGSTVVVAVSYFALDFSTMVDNQSPANTYTQVGSEVIAGTNARLSVYYAKNVTASGTFTVTTTFTGSADDITVAIHEYIGVDEVSPVDKNRSNTGTGAAAPTTGASITTQDNEVIFGAITTDSGGVVINMTSGTNYTERIKEVDATQFEVLGTEDRYPAAAGSHAATWASTEIGGLTYAAILVSLKPNFNLKTTLIGPTWQTENMCVNGKCLYFDGSNDYTIVSDNAAIDVVAADNLVVSAWVKHSGPIATNPDYIITKATSGTYTGYKLYMDASGDFCFDVGDGTNSDSACTSAVDFDDDQWHFVEGVKAGTTSVTLYVDGKQRAQDASVASTGTLANANNFYIGIDRDATSNPWAGFIDEVKVFNDQLPRTAGQILADYNARANPEGLSAQLGNNIQNMPEALSNGLTGYWKMNESSWNGTSGEVIDSSGNGNNGTAYSGTTTASGKFGRSGLQTARTHGVNLGDDTDFEKTTFTISAWVYRTSDTDNDHKVFTKGLSGNTGYGLEVDNLGSGHKAQIRLNDTQQVTGTTTLTANTWYHIAGTIDGTTVKVYVNGVLETATAQTQLPFFSTEEAKIGNGNTATDLGFIGNLDEVRFYNRALSPAEISNLYNFAPSPVGYWDFEEGSGLTAYDRSTNANTGTITAGTGGYLSSKFGKGYNFDAATTVVNAGSGATLDDLPATGMSLDAWIYPKTMGENTAGVIMAKNVGTTPSAGWLLRFSGTNALTFTVDGSTDLVRATSNSVVTLNAWNHVAMSWDGVITTAASVHIYINGVEVSYATTTNGVARVADASSTFFIGNDSTSARTFNGYIDEAKVYNYALESRQIIQDMDGGHPIGGSPVGSSVAYWKFDEGYSTTANDTSSQNGSENLTLSSATAWINAGKFNKAFDGGDNKRASMGGDDADLDFAGTDSFSISLWFKSDSVNDPSTNEYLVEKGATVGSAAIGYAIYTSSSGGTVCFGIDDDAVSNFPEDSSCSTTDIYDNTWHHIVARKNGTTKLDLFVDGKPNGTADTSISATGTLDTASVFRVGDANATDGTDEFLGDLDEIKVYRTALTPQEVLIDYNHSSAEVLGAMGDNTSSEKQAASQEYCVPGDSTTCTGPVLRWDFEEGSGTSAQDTSGNALTGTLTNSPLYVSGKVGKSLQFDGSTNYVTVADNSLLNPNAGGWTAEVWAKPANSNQSSALIAKRENSGNFEQWALYITGDADVGSNGQQLVAYMRESGSNQRRVISDDDVADGNWHHYAMVANPTTDNVRIFKDGAELKVTASTDGTYPNVNTTDPLRIGNNNGSTYFNGPEDLVRVFNYARTASQVAWDANKGKPMGYWKFDECQGTTIYDSAGNGYTGTWSGGSGSQTTTGNCATNAATAWYAGRNGKYNSSLNFDGTDDNIDLGSFDFTELQSSLSWSYWVKPGTLSTSDCMWCKFQNDTTATTWGIETGSSDSSTVRAHIPTTNTLLDAYGETPTGTLTNGVWTHVAVVFDGLLSGNSNRLKVYINGKPVTLTFTGTIPAATTAINDASPLVDNAYFGRAPDGAVGRYFNGQIDDARLFSFPLTQTQAQTVANDGAIHFGPDTGPP